MSNKIQDGTFYKVIIVGGSYSGLSAALQLARARQDVLVLDGGARRNERARSSHGYLSQDGAPSEAIIRKGKDELQGYANVTFRETLAVAAAAQQDGFVVELSDGMTARAQRVILAVGVRDELPNIPGLAEKWGDAVAMCPYCHAYEFGGQPMGVIGGNPALSLHQVELLPDWGPTTYFMQGQDELSGEAASMVAKRGVTLERSPIIEMLGTGTKLEAVRLADRRVIPLRFALVAPITTVAGSLAQGLGCAMEDGVTGRHIKTDEWKQTSIPNVYAVGDASSPYHIISVATTSGTMAGVSAHASLAVAR
jgi:thioredoxin reductase